jgi:hypothetical protein
MKITTKTLFVLLGCLSATLAFGQYPCGTKPLTDAQRQTIFTLRKQFEKARLAADPLEKTADTTQVKGPDDGITYFPIRAHITRKNKKPSFDIAGLNNSIAVTNRHFRAAGKGIQFYLAGTDVSFVDDTTFYEYESSAKDSLGRNAEQRITSRYGVRNAINVYFCNSVKAGTSEVGGYAYFPDSAYYSNHVFMASGQSNDNITLPHELGHYFQLAHTFDNSADADTTERELVTRLATEKKPRLPANCDTKGDLICDTPADPYDRIKKTFSGCIYDWPASKIADANGDAYKPQMNNIMAYFQCGIFFFTGGQLGMMGGIALQKRLSTDNKYVVSGTKAWQPTVVKPPVLRKLKLNNPGGVVIAWADSSKNETGFLIERASSKNGPFLGIGGVQPNDTMFTDQSVIRGQKYFYRVKPSNTTTAAYTKIDSVQIDSLQICAPLYAIGCTDGDFIETFAMNGETRLLNQKSGCSPGGYGNFIGKTVSVRANNKYPFLITIPRDSTGFYPTSVAIWLDANADGVFSGSAAKSDTSNVNSEMLFSGKITGENSVIDTLTIPKIQKAGTYRLRVRTQRLSAGPVTSACDLFNRGEAEDYGVVVLTGTGRQATETIAEIPDGIVFPNPSDGRELFLRRPAGVNPADVSLHNFGGQTIATQQQVVDTETISIKPTQKLTPGLYLLKLRSDGKSSVYKVLVTE